MGELKIKPTLATNGWECRKLESLLKQGMWVSPKLDGYRCLAVIKDGKCKLFSRNGKEFKNFPELVSHIEEHLGHLDIILDGEVMSDDFSALQQSAFAIKRGTTVGNITYHVFDTVSNKTKQHRIADLSHHIKETDKIKLLKHSVCFDIINLKRYLEISLGLGYEGLMAITDVPYSQGRKANTMFKFKPHLEMDCMIKEIHVGEGKYSNTLGHVVVQQPNGDLCGVGSGFTDTQRDEIYSDSESHIGKMIEVHYQELTKDGIMRFPVFKRFREDKE